MYLVTLDDSLLSPSPKSLKRSTQLRDIKKPGPKRATVDPMPLDAPALRVGMKPFKVSFYIFDWSKLSRLSWA